MLGDGNVGAGALPPAIGRYRILSRLAQDAVGEILKGFDPLIERPVVVKVFHLHRAEAGAIPTITGRFYQEMQRIGALVHQGIVPLFDAGPSPSGLFMASEFVDGISLADLIAGGQARAFDSSMALVAQMVDALEYAHSEGVPHTNLQSRNVMLTSDGLVKVSGFGLAAVVDAIAAAGGGVVPVTRSTAPERVRGEPGDARSDVYALTTLVADLLADHPVEADPGEWPLPASLAARGVEPDRWAALIARGRAADPVDRFSGVRALYQELVAVLHLEAPSARPTWDRLGPGSTLALDADSVDTETTVSPGHDDRTVELSRTRRSGSEADTLAADSVHGRGGSKD